MKKVGLQKYKPQAGFDWVSLVIVFIQMLDHYEKCVLFEVQKTLLDFLRGGRTLMSVTSWSF